MTLMALLTKKNANKKNKLNLYIYFNFLIFFLYLFASMEGSGAVLSDFAFFSLQAGSSTGVREKSHKTKNTPS